MLKTVKILRSTFRFLAYGAGILVLGQLLVLFYLYFQQDGRGAGELVVKMAVNGILWLIFQSLSSLLGALERTLLERQARLAAQSLPEQGTTPRQVNKGKVFVAIAAVASATGLMIWHYKESGPKDSKVAIASECTSTYTAAILHFPNLKGYTPDQVAAAFLRDVAPEDMDQRLNLTQELLECRWHRTLVLVGETYYVDPHRMLLFPNNRRAIPLLVDYYAKRTLSAEEKEKEKEKENKNYQSSAAILLVGCDQFGTRYFRQTHHSAWFGKGSVISYSDGSSGFGANDVAMAPLHPTEKGSIGRSLAEAICSID